MRNKIFELVALFLLSATGFACGDDGNAYDIVVDAAELESTLRGNASWEGTIRLPRASANPLGLFLGVASTASDGGASRFGGSCLRVNLGNDGQLSSGREELTYRVQNVQGGEYVFFLWADQEGGVDLESTQDAGDFVGYYQESGQGVVDADAATPFAVASGEDLSEVDFAVPELAEDLMCPNAVRPENFTAEQSAYCDQLPTNCCAGLGYVEANQAECIVVAEQGAELFPDQATICTEQVNWCFRFGLLLDYEGQNVCSDLRATCCEGSVPDPARDEVECNYVLERAMRTFPDPTQTVCEPTQASCLLELLDVDTNSDQRDADTDNDQRGESSSRNDSSRQR